MHRFRPGPALLLAAMLTSSAAVAQDSTAKPLNIHGISYAPSLQLQGKSLLLNGAGTRYKAVFKVYTAGLYLEKPARNLQEIAALPGLPDKARGAFALIAERVERAVFALSPLDAGDWQAARAAYADFALARLPAAGAP